MQMKGELKFAVVTASPLSSIMKFNQRALIRYLQYPFLCIHVEYALKAIVAGVRELANRQEMNVTMANPGNGFIPNAPHSTLQIRGVADESRDISKARVIEMRTNHRQCYACRLLHIILIVILINAAIIINFVGHQFVMVGIKRRCESCR